MNNESPKAASGLMAEPLPVWTPEAELFHIGTLDPLRKTRTSYEGHGLSVSECPDAWSQIARLGGNPWWELMRASEDDGEDGEVPRGRFLDLYKLTDPAKEEILAWALKEQLCEPYEVWIVRFLDEDENWSEMHFESEADARKELAFLQEDLDDEETDPLQRCSIRQEQAWKLTKTALDALHRDGCSTHETEKLIAVLWADRCTDLDGAFWGSVLEPYALSAPCAVIFPDRLQRWTASCVRQVAYNSPGRP